MIRQILAAGVSAAALALAMPAAAQASPSPEEASVLPVMEFGTWGVDPALLDSTVKPGDDFFAYVNGKWIRDNPMPAEFTRFGAFDLLNEKSIADVKALVDELVAANPAPGTSERRIVDAYNAYMDTAAIDAAGLAPAKPWLDRINGAKDLADLAELFGQPGYPALVGAGVDVDFKEPDSYIVSVGFDGMGLPDRDYYLDDSEEAKAIQAQYREFIGFLLGKAGYADPAASAQAVYDFEHKVAELEWARQALRNRDITYNKLSRAELAALAPGFPLDRLLASAQFANQDHFLVNQLPPTAAEIQSLGLSEDFVSGIGGGLPAMMKLLEETPLETLKAFMTAHFLANNAPVLPHEIDDANFAFYGTVLSGQQEQRPRWKRAIGATEAQLGEQLGALYAARYFPAASKTAMEQLVGNLRTALAESIEQSAWMTDATKPEAIAKLDAFVPRIGYPENPKTYDGLAIAVDTPLANRIGAAAWQAEFDRNRLGQKVDRTEWGYYAQTVNAGYSPNFNTITFPGAILQQPFFSPTADPAVNYGAIGAVIGHEMGHGFDDQGAKSDGIGMLRDWWAPQDKAQFEALGNRLAAQYDRYCPWDDGKTCVNGRLTLGENIGDVGGLNLAYRAYRMSLNGKELPVIDGLTGDQRFF
ncbi:MAG TPA: M13 family metallopeptidase, partial [Croceibacterium sp.]|nr:M13 family metallopeptidase [Croceibacterium sp.]